MARPRKFDEQRAVDSALEAFWTAGYEATSTQDLCEATGLGRSSVYNTFHSKHDLFLRVLDRYMERRAAEQFALLESDRPVRDKLRELLRSVIAEECGESEGWTAGAGRGCLVVNTAVELSGRDEAVADRLRRDYQRRFEVVRAAVEAGMRAGEIEPGRDAHALAHFVIAAVSGMRVSARGGGGRAAMEAIADTAVRAL